MPEIRITPNQLRSKAEELRQLGAQFSSQVTNLENEQTRLAGMWEGDAKQAFQTAFMKDKGQMDNFKQLIDQYCETLIRMAADYDKTEANNASIANARKY